MKYMHDTEVIISAHQPRHSPGRADPCPQVRLRSRAEIAARSCVFHTVIVLWFVASLPFTPMLVLAPRNLVKWVFHLSTRGYLGLLKLICGLHYELRGIENIPEHPVLFASKHLSKWDSILSVLLGDAATVLRQDLLLFPVYGTVIRRMRHLPITRRSTPAAAAHLVDTAKLYIRKGRSVLIFPEGTRTPVDPFPTPKYKHGVVALYKALGIPCVPIALNSGLFWPSKSLMRYPGTIVAEILPSIPPGLDPSEFLIMLTRQIENNSQRLVQEAIARGRPQSDQFCSPDLAGNRTR